MSSSFVSVAFNLFCSITSCLLCAQGESDRDLGSCCGEEKKKLPRSLEWKLSVQVSTFSEILNSNGEMAKWTCALRVDSHPALRQMRSAPAVNRSCVRFPGRSNRIQRRNGSPSLRCFFEAVLARHQTAEMDPVTRYTLRRNTASIMKTWF